MSEKGFKVRIDLEGDTKKIFETIKEEHNLNIKAEVILLIIKLTKVKEFPDI